MQTQFNSIKTARKPIAFSIDLNKRRNWYADETTDTTTETTKDTTATKTDAKAETKFTQEDMDRVAGNRAKEAAAAAVKKLLKDLGVDPEDAKALDTVKGKLTAAEAAEKAAMTKEQLLQQERDAALKERDEMKSLADKERLERQIDRRDTTVKAALSDPKLHCKSPDKVFKLLKADHQSELDALLKDDGTVDEAKLKTFVDLGKKENAEYFTGGNPGIPSNQGGRPAAAGNEVVLKRRIQG